MKNIKVFKLEEIEEFISFCKSLDRIVALDYEASSLEVHKKDFELAGIGISDLENGAYLLINCLEERNELSKEEISKIVGLYKHLEQTRTILVYNKSYEVAVTKRIFNYDIRVLDVLVVATTLAERGSLKDNTRKFVLKEKVDSKFSPFIEDEEEDYKEENFWEENIGHWTKALKTVIGSFLSKKGKENKHFTSFVEQVNLMDEGAFYIKPEVKLKGLNSGFDKLFELIEAEVPPEDQGHLKMVLFETIIERVNELRPEINYTYIPQAIISKYCIDDVFNTCKLFQFFIGKMKELDYSKAFESYNKQTDLAIILQNNGAAWNDNTRVYFVDILNDHLIQRLKKLILNERVIEKLEIPEMKVLEITTSLDLEFLKLFINPRSIKTRDIIEKVIFNTAMKIAWFLKSADDFIKKQANYGKKVLRNLNKYLVKYNSAEELLSIKEQLSQDIFYYKQNGTYKEKEFFDTQLDKFTLPGFDSKIVIPKIHFIFKNYFNIDFEDEKSYYSTPESAFFVDLFLCKKIMKEISGFDSKLGLQKVSSKEELHEDFECDYKYTPSFNPVAMETRRWGSGMHTLATNSHIRDCLEPIYGDNGINIHFDAGQSEVRVIAMIAGEEKLIQAYRDGLDIHRFNASMMLNKPMDQVTGTERSVAKAMTFGILYGKSAAKFVEGGTFKTVAEAEKAFSDFYSAYPKIKQWMDNKHDEVLKYGGVFTHYGDFLKIEFNRDSEKEVAEAQRSAVNWPIQHYSSCSAGIVIRELNEYYKKSGIRACPYSFIHDSCDMNVHLEDFIEVIYGLREKVNSIYLEKTGIEMDIDIGIGVNFGSCNDIKLIDNNNFEISGLTEDIEKIVSRLSKHYNLEASFVEDGFSIIDLKELFIKSAYNVYYNVPRKKTKCHITINHQLK
jgi:DNA polymerase I-like protein with 3'-5' exonuclease and polymerase domains